LDLGSEAFPFRFQQAGDPGYFVLGRTDAEGELMLADLPPESVRVAVVSRRTAPVVIEIGERRAELRVVARASAPITGRVIPTLPSDLAARVIALRDPRAGNWSGRSGPEDQRLYHTAAWSRLDADGRFSLGGLDPRRSYRVVLVSDETGSRTDAVRASSGSELELVARSAPRVRASVRDGATGAALESARLSLVGVLDAQAVARHSLVDPDAGPEEGGLEWSDAGRFQPGTYQGFVRARGYAPQPIGPLRIESGVHDLGIVRLVRE
jgi:hypothetical protein